MDISDNSMLDKESVNNNVLNSVVDNLTFMDSSLDVDLLDLNEYSSEPNKPLKNVHTPSPMVTRSYLNENHEPWKNKTIYSYSPCSVPEEIDVSDNLNGPFNLHGENTVPVTQNWINYKQHYSPELKRDTDIIFEEKTVNEKNGDLENSDYSDQSQSPDNSVSSNDNISDSSSDSSSDDKIPTTEEPTPEIAHTYRTTTEPCRDFQEIFNAINRDALSAILYHQPPKALDRDAANRLARRLFECDGFKITDVAKHLAKRNDFSQIVGEEFANFFDFTNLRLDKALRLFLGRFTLTGETQERERIMHHFSKRYVTCNPDLYNGEDACHTLVCALIILNTNLHSQTQQRMLCNDFILNLKDLNEGENFPVDNLKDLYSAIEQDPIRWPMDDELVGIVNVPKQDFFDYNRQMVKPSYSIGLDLPRDSNCRDFMSGYVVRKWLKELGGRKAAFGKRGWKLFFGRLRDLTLYLYKDHDKSVSQFVQNSKPHKSNKASKSKTKGAEKRTKKSNNPKLASNKSAPPSTVNVQPNGDHENSAQNPVTDEIVQSNSDSKDTLKPKDPPSSFSSGDASSTNIAQNLVLPPADCEIHINHAFATRALDYQKKKNVFRIKTKYGSEYLFQVNTEKEIDSWVDNINYVAALLSDPEPTIGICTMEKMNARTLPLPKITLLNARDQLESHQRCVLELDKVVASLKENIPRKLDKRARSELEESIRFREDELQRYKTYCQLLEFELVRMQSIVNIRLSGADPPMFYQPLQMNASNTTPSHFLNPTIVIGQPMLNNYSVPDNFTNTSFINPQSNTRYRAPMMHQNMSAAISANRRLRYRVPGPLNMVQNVVAQSESESVNSACDVDSNFQSILSSEKDSGRGGGSSVKSEEDSEGGCNIQAILSLGEDSEGGCNIQAIFSSQEDSRREDGSSVRSVLSLEEDSGGGCSNGGVVQATGTDDVAPGQTLDTANNGQGNINTFYEIV